MVEKIAAFPRFSEVLKEHLETNETKFLQRLNGGHLRFLELKSSKVFTKTDKRIQNWKCQMNNSVGANSLHFEV